ncbi:MAG: 50S ribosomal protein L32e [Candidatus Nanohaloarchaeota archaeon]|nr:50S ribosomal protein L32e [Candidatus Nanohaloarchaeota archaeon]
MKGNLKELVKLRKELKKRIPTFKRVNASRYESKLGDKWRKQRGRHNKIRRGIKGAGSKVSVGYGTQKDARHLHPAGYEEIKVESLKDLDKVKDTNTQAVRIASSVGLKKRLEILREAKKRGIYVLNERIIARVKKKGYSSLSDLLGAIGKKAKITKSSEEKEKTSTFKEESKNNKEGSKEMKDKKSDVKLKVSKSQSKKSSSQKTKQTQKSNNSTKDSETKRATKSSKKK